MREMKIHQGWHFGAGTPGPFREGAEEKTVNLPHDYMIGSDVFPEAPSRQASGYYNAGVAYYWKEVEIPREWEGERIALRLDGAMMNATLEVNGAMAALQHYGYAPFEVDITRLVCFGKKNRIQILLNPSMQPNSRWYSGAGLFRDVRLLHMPLLHIAFGGLAGYTRKIEYTSGGEAESACLQLSAEISNGYAENRLAEVCFSLIREDTGETVLSRRTRTQVPPLSAATARSVMTVDAPLLWSAENPNLYRLEACVRDGGTYRTHIVPSACPTEDRESVLFGIRTVEADVRHGLRISGREVKLKGGCLHHDNGVIGAVSLYDAEARKVRQLKEVGFNAIRTTHNPPSSALIEACDRLGMYIFDEAFDVWGMGKQPGDYNQFFACDWEKDLAAFVRRDRCHPCVILWSTGNEITERAGLNDGYVWADRLASAIRALDPSRPVSNGICSFWSGLDDELREKLMKEWAQAGSGELQNAHMGRPEELLWENYTEAFANGLDVVGYNYLESLYAQDHEMFPERVILGSENFPIEIGQHWPVIEKTPWIIGDFTWTAWDYIGEAGIGQAIFYEPEDPSLKSVTPWGHSSPFPWRTANDSDFDITGKIRPQGVYRRIVWHSPETALFSYDPAVHGKVEILTRWGFPQIWERWNWAGMEHRPVDLVVFSGAEEVELFINGKSQGRLKAGESPVHDMPLSFLFHAQYVPGTVEAVSYTGGREVSRASLVTTSAPKALRLCGETEALHPDGASLACVRVLIVDEEGRTVPDADLPLTVQVQGQGELLGFGSGRPVTDENYTRASFMSYMGEALAVVRAGYEEGQVTLRFSAPGLQDAVLTLPVR